MHRIDDAELSALGLLEAVERDRIDEHVRTCDLGAQRLGRAEAAVAALVASSQRWRTWQLPSWSTAVAAAFALTSAVLTAQNHTLRGALAADGRSYDALVQSHFAHAMFVSPAGTPIAAKAIYERHGHWLQIVAERPADWRAIQVGSNGKRRPVEERPVARGAASLLVVSPVASIELEDAGGRTIASVQPAVTL